jgi:SPP1 gp7 family putative phage head morphogenesis protein
MAKKNEPKPVSSNRKPNNENLAQITVVNQPVTVGIVERGNQSVQKWISAVKQAENLMFPQRRELYVNYLDITIDGHLRSMIEKRVRAVKTTPFEWSGLENDKLIENFGSGWFHECIDLIMSRKFWGPTLIEHSLGPDGLVAAAELIPRQNVKPEKGLISIDGYSDSGFPYREGELVNYILEVGKPRELGLLANLGPYVLMKRNNLSDFARYNEMFGIDMRVYEYEPTKPTARAEMEKQAKDQGSAAYIIIPKGGGQVTFPTSNKQSSAYAFDKFHAIMNEEITICVLGQTLTTSVGDSGSRALGDVQMSVEKAINLEDRLEVEMIVNYKLRPNILIPHGYELQNIKGKFKTADEISREKKLELWIKLYESGAPIAEEDFYKEFGIQPPGSRVVVASASSGPTLPDPKNPDAPVPPTGGNPPKPQPGGPVKKKPVKLSAEIAELYSHKCERDKSPHRVTLSYANDLEKLIESIIQRLYNGELKPGDVDAQLYNLFADELWKATEKGYGITLEAAAGADVGMLKALRTNVYVFSGFKNYQFLKEASELLTDANGSVKPFAQFRNDVLKLNSAYNVDYLRTEYNYAIASSQTAGMWTKIQSAKGMLPYLQYHTVGDSRVRAAHARLDGIIKLVDDPFWDKYMPPNAWNCRCTVKQLAEAKVTDTQADNLPQINPMFAINSGKHAIVFPKSHPYYTVAPGDQDAADNNFGLPIPD